MICIYICNLFNGDQIPRNSTYPHEGNNETEITQERWREFLVLKEGPNSTCSMSKLIASYLSLVLRGRKG